jgi:hypothetical protein
MRLVVLDHLLFGDCAVGISRGGGDDEEAEEQEKEHRIRSRVLPRHFLSVDLSWRLW